MSKSPDALDFSKAWQDALTAIFPKAIPSSASWAGPAAIVDVLKTLGSYRSSNHMFFPTGGGMDLTSARLGHEPNSIELIAGFVVIVRPIELVFNAPGGDAEWAYFRLESGGLAPSGAYPADMTGDDEEVTELSPGQYVERSAWDAGYYGTDDEGREKPLPKESRCVRRTFRGPFVFFGKGSTYNKVSETYDGRHAKMTAAEFRNYIERSAKAL